MKNKFTVFGLIGSLFFIGTPSIASTNSPDISLTPGQVKFIKYFDSIAKTNFSSMINTPGSNYIINAASFACGNTSFQKKLIISAGGNNTLANKISNKFETLFCASDYTSGLN